MALVYGPERFATFHFVDDAFPNFHKFLKRYQIFSRSDKSIAQRLARNENRRSMKIFYPCSFLVLTVSIKKNYSTAVALHNICFHESISAVLILLISHFFLEGFTLASTISKSRRRPQGFIIINIYGSDSQYSTALQSVI